MNETSTLSFGVRTDSALASLKALTDALAKIPATARIINQQLNQNISEGAAGVTSSMRKMGEDSGKALAGGVRIGVEGGINVAYRAMGNSAAKIVEQSKAAAEKMKAELAAAGIQTAEEVKAANKRSLIQQLRDVQTHNAKVKESERELATSRRVYHQLAVAERKEALAQETAAQRAELLKQSQQYAAYLIQQREFAAGLKSGFEHGPDRATIYRLQDAQRARELADAQRASSRALAVTSDSQVRNAETTRRWTTAQKEAHGAVRGLTGALGALWLSYGSAPSIATMAAGFAISASVRKAIEDGKEFQYQLEFTRAIAGETAESFKGVGDAILNISRESLYGPVEAAKGLRILTQSGLDSRKALEALPPVLDLATAGETSVADAAETAQGVMHAFKLEVEDVSHIGDVLAKAAAVSATDVGQMSEAMKQAATVGSQYGITLEQTSAALALLAERHIVGTSAGTAWKNMARELYAPTDKAREAMDRLGLKSYAEGKMKSVPRIMDEIRARVQKLDAESRNHFFSIVFGERGVKAADAFFSATKERVDELVSSLQNADGFMKRVVDILEASTKGQFIQAWNNFSVSLINGFKEAEPALRSVAQALLDTFKSDNFQQFVTIVVSGSAQIIKFVVENTGTILDLAKAYITLRAAMLAVSAVNFAQGLATSGTILVQTLIAVRKSGEGAAVALNGASGLRGAVSVLSSAFPILGTAIAALGTPLGIITGIVVGGITAWTLWGNSASAALAKARAQADETKKSTAEFLADLDKQKARESAGVTDPRLVGISDQIEKEKSAIAKLPDIYGKGNYSSDYKKEYAEHISNIQKLSAEYQRLRAAQAPSTPAAKTATSGTEHVDFGNSKDASNLLKAEASAAVEKYRNQEQLARSAYDAERKMANEAFRGRVISSQEYLAQRKAAEDAYLEATKAAESKAADEINGLKGRAEKESERLRLKNAITHIQNQAAERAAQDEINQKLEVQNRLIREQIEARNYLTETLPKLTSAGARSRKKEFDARDNDLLSERDRIAAEASAAARDKFGSNLDGLRQRLSLTDQDLQRMDEMDKALGVASLATANLRKEKALLEEQINATTEAMSAEGESAAAAAQALYDHNNTFQKGARRGLRSYLNEIGNVARQSESLVTKAFQGMEDALVNFVKTGKLDFRSLAESIISDLIRIQVRASITSAVGGGEGIGGILGLFSGLFSGGGSAAAGAASSVGSDAFSAALYTAAQGRVFAGPGIHAYSNSVVTRPTVFAFAQGIGLIGEKPGSPGEAVMPLSRMAGGDLGVKVSTDGVSAGGTTNYVTINVNTDGSTKRNESSDKQGAELGRKLEAAVKKVLVEEKRPGGLLAA